MITSFWRGFELGNAEALAVGKTDLHCPQGCRGASDRSPQGYIYGWHSAQDALRGEPPRMLRGLNIFQRQIADPSLADHRMVSLSSWETDQFQLSGPEPGSDVAEGAFTVFIYGVKPDVTSEQVLKKYSECIVPWVPVASPAECSLPWQSLSRAVPGVPIDPSLSQYLDTSHYVYLAPGLVAVIPVRDVIPFGDDHDGR